MKTKGFYVIEHRPTGQRYTGVSMDVKNDTNKLKYELTTASTPNTRLNALAKRDNDFKFQINEFATIPEAREFERKFRAHIPNHLLIN